ncbi:sigma-70 family RNA polymerase sigma factor [Roseibacillus ishigakijimensis]|uniref:Sigma-70 family RNA polymerase sigma factor n=1 Tax=Roseibacillus ishigakijimensis TaxID=454146 RepID=A0A934VN09_9BACT|nr:sigma-70 family RNA polymerase sigma factor [Roseibacillus ishigakijimensis]MBK1834530.1 sigma-70 family RNA polymerase sigma factor [Roseibacillus ishigakijimensis]
MSSAASPEDLLAQVAEGSPDAFSQLYDEFASALLGITLGILKNRAEAEETLQDVFVTIWKSAHQYRPELGKASTWLISLTRNRAIDRLRSRQRRDKLADAAKSETFREPGEPSPDSPLIAAELSERVRQSLKTLPEEMRTVLELAFFHSLTHHEISEYLNQPLGTVKSRIRRAMERIKTTLSDISDYRTES